MPCLSEIFFLYFPKVLSKILTGSSYLDRLMKHWNKGLRLSGPWCSKDLTTILKDLIWGRSTSIIKFDKRWRGLKKGAKQSIIFCHGMLVLLGASMFEPADEIACNLPHTNDQRDGDNFLPFYGTSIFKPPLPQLYCQFSVNVLGYILDGFYAW